MQLRSPLVMFLLGLGVALLSPSLTVSCGLLFPFYAKGYLGTGGFVPYVMGANVSTFSGTLLAAFALPSVAALQVMTAELISVGVVSLMILLAGFSTYKRMIESWMDYFTESPKRLAQFLVLTFFVPVVLLIV
jgi:Na+/phosphate symporter